jgi:hypothetical protein
MWWQIPAVVSRFRLRLFHDSRLDVYGDAVVPDTVNSLDKEDLEKLQQVND